MDEGATVDSDHSMTWEDVYGSTTDLTSTLIGIYDSFLQPTTQNRTDHKDNATHTIVDTSKREHQTTGGKHSRERARLPGIAEVAGEILRNSIPTEEVVSSVRDDTATSDAIHKMNVAISSNESDTQNGAINSSFTSSHSHTYTSVTLSSKYNKSISSNYKLNPQNVESDPNKKPVMDNSQSSFENLSPNVKRIMNSASSVSTGKLNVFIPRRTNSNSSTSVRNSGRSPKISNIPLIGTTSKMTQSRDTILSSADIYDQPKANSGSIKSPEKLTAEDLFMQCNSAVKTLPQAVSNSSPSSPDDTLLPRRDSLYDVPTNSQSIYDIPVSGKKNMPTLDALSLPYIDQSLEYTSTANDREFDPRLSKDFSPEVKSDSVHSHSQKPVSEKDFETHDSISRGRKLNFDDAMDAKTHLDNSVEESSRETAPKLTKLSVKQTPGNFTHPKRLLKAGNYPEAIGSTGNLKLCSGLSDQGASRLEVSRPLSMSSIASSSSTSSSGVQNKGGVNSAYLASIESLDDHSDGEVMSATGSSGFVNSGLNGVSCLPGGSAAPEHELEGSGLTQLQLLCAEIVNTEIIYVEDLRQVIEGYLQEWRGVNMFTEETLNDLFSNIEDIYEFNSTLCDALKTCDLDATAIARCFLNNTAGFCVYAAYCTAYPRTMSVLAQLALDPQAAKALRQRQAALGHPLPVSSYLLKPVQRILRYPLLLKNMVKHCKSMETESAFSKMTEIAQDTDDMKRKHEHRIRVQEIQSLLYGWSGPDLTTFGELCAEGTFRVFGAKAVRHAFLFDKMLLLTKHREDGILSYKSDIMCNNLMLVECIAGAPLCFHVIPFNNPKGQLTLQARSARHKREWTLLLKRVILENYQAVIPNHAKQLVMELGQNKTDDDIIAEKSHNLISHTSMRKQLSAPPEYLEKRKMDRERRKTCDTNGIRGPVNKKISPKHAKVIRSPSRDDICQNCHDLCSDCEVELSLSHSKNENDDSIETVENLCICQGRCAECDRSLHFIDSGSVDNLERKQSTCTKCSSGIGGSMESCRSQDYDTNLVAKENRPYRSSENVSCACSVSDIKNDSALDDNSSINSHSIKRTCLKCSMIKENIASTNDVNAIRKSRLKDVEVSKIDSGRSKSKEDIHRTKIPKIGTWRRKSEPGFQQNSTELLNKYDSSAKCTENVELNTCSRCSQVELECRNCGNLIRKFRNDDEIVNRQSIRNSRRRNIYKANTPNPNNEASAIEVKMYNTKNLPKKITKIKKNRAKASKVSPTKHTDSSTAKFYADLSGNISNENILHISESTDSVNTINNSPKRDRKFTEISEMKVSKDLGIDEETYQRLIQKTDSFKKTELERDKCIQKLKDTSENDVIEHRDISKVEEEILESEKPLEQIISQLLMQNREFQKILKKHQMRNTAQRRHQRLLKSHSNPEKSIPLHVKEQNQKIKPKYGRQTSAIETVNPEMMKFDEMKCLTPTNEIDSDNEHIYETLRIDTRSETTQKINNAKSEISNSVGNLVTNEIPEETSQNCASESDYVYLKFGAISTVTSDDVLYATPSKIMNMQRVQDDIATETYPSMENEIMENIYDNLVDLRLRAKQETQSEVLNDTGYLLTSDKPNTPEIWILQQKEHFTTSRDRKSGSLPRSFQVVLNSKEDTNIQSKVTSPTNKTYLNKDGKVLSIDRPFTIASDKSEISYDDVEQYMNDEGNILKFNKMVSSNRSSRSFSYESETPVDHLSHSTMDLEEEIDKCYKTNIVNNKMDLDASTNILSDSRKIDNSISTSMEILSPDKSIDMRENLLVHPEHKIYKPTSNLLSLKNVLNRFKNKTPVKNSTENIENKDDSSIIDNSGSEKNSPKSNNSSPQKKSGLNPRSYSKNLMQRFKNIIGDEQPNESSIKDFEDIKRSVVNEIKVIITRPEGTLNTSTYTSVNVNKVQDGLSKSVCETISSDQLTDLDALSKSCDNIVMSPVKIKAKFEKCRSVSVTNSTASKLLSASHQNFNKLPIYKQGSKYLGARIAQSDYVDPQTLFSGVSKTDLENVNVLINKNAMRPDSLLSNSSHFTSSSDGCTHNDVITKQIRIIDNSYDESFYEKSFEQIENLIDEEVFRDSAVYSDQDETDIQKTLPIKNIVMPTRVIKAQRIRNVFVNNEIKLENTPVYTHQIPIRKIGSPLKNISLKTESQTEIHRKEFGNTIKKSHNNDINEPNIHDKLSKSNLQSRIESKCEENETPKAVETLKIQSKIINTSKIAPPIPVKPTLKSPKPIQSRNEGIIQNPRTDILEQKTINNSKESNEIKTTDGIHPCVDASNVTTFANTKTCNKVETFNKPVFERSSSSNIQIKRLSFERSSLDSTSHRPKNVLSLIQTPNVENVIMKSVHERRMEIESFTKKITNTNEISVISPNRRSNEFTQPQNSLNVIVKMASNNKHVNEISKRESQPGKDKSFPTRIHSNLPTVKKTSIPQAHSSIETHKYNTFNKNSIKDSDNCVNLACTNDKLAVPNVEVTDTNVKFTDANVKLPDANVNLADANVKLTVADVKMTDANDEVTDLNTENEAHLNTLDSRESWVKQIVNKFQ